MKKSVKTLAFITITSFLFYSAAAQSKLPGINNGVAHDVKKVIEDYTN